MNTKTKRRIYYALLISLAIHLGFVIWSFFVRVLPYKAEVDKPQIHVHMQMAKEESHGQSNQNLDKETSQKTLQPIDPFAEMQNVEPSTLSKEEVRQNIESAVQKQDQAEMPSTAQDMEDLQKPQIDQTITPKVRRATRENLVDVGDIPQADLASGAPTVAPGEDISKNFLDKSNQSMRLAPAMRTQGPSGSNEFQVMKKSSSGISRKMQSVELGTNLTYELSKYKDPKSGQKYFKLLVKVRDATVNFAVIPKEIIFLMDSSQSIGEERLQQFEKGVVYSLNHLNAQDRFNVIIFKDKSIPFSPNSLSPTPENIKDAIDFVKSFRAGSTTDVYNAVQSSLNLDHPFVPSYRVLLSDGFPTRGILDARQVINTISANNDGKVSIFAFGGGVDVSPYMLDFIAYKNRGWAQVEDRDYAMGKSLSKMYDRIKDPLLLNLRYHISGVDSAQVFPHILPDFFKGSEFVIYGTYTNKENKIFVQVLGNVLGETKEFIVNGALANATLGNRDIARQWAFHKVYYLISQLKAHEENEDLIDQIDDLCAEFKIVTPYSRNFRRVTKPRAAIHVQQSIKPKHHPIPTKPKQNF